jgi:hypothetical protein
MKALIFTPMVFILALIIPAWAAAAAGTHEDILVKALIAIAAGECPASLMAKDIPLQKEAAAGLSEQRRKFLTQALGLRKVCREVIPQSGNFSARTIAAKRGWPRSGSRSGSAFR